MTATHYGRAYNGQPLGCGGGVYVSEDPTITAVGNPRSGEWPCGTQLQVCGSLGCIVAERKDGCPGCGSYVIDLSERGIALVCGEGTSTCDVNVQKVRVVASAVAIPPPPVITLPGPLGLLPSLRDCGARGASEC